MVASHAATCVGTGVVIPEGGRGGSGGETKRVRLAEGYSGRVRLAISKSRPFLRAAA